MTRALNMPKPLIMPPATSAILSTGPPINWAMSAQAPVSQALAGRPVIHMAAKGRT